MEKFCQKEAKSRLTVNYAMKTRQFRAELAHYNFFSLIIEHRKTLTIFQSTLSYFLFVQLEAKKQNDMI